MYSQFFDDVVLVVIVVVVVVGFTNMKAKILVKYKKDAQTYRQPHACHTLADCWCIAGEPHLP